MSKDFIIRIVFENVPLLLLVVGAICSLISLGRKPKALRSIALTDAFFSFFLLFSIGIGFIYYFSGELLQTIYGTSCPDWAHSPLQPEVGYAGLGIGIAGLISFRAGLGFRAATMIIPAFYLWGSAGAQLYQMFMMNEFSLGNTDAVLWVQVLLPAIGLFLLYQQYKSQA